MQSARPNYEIKIQQKVNPYPYTESEVSKQIQTKEAELQSTTNPETCTKVKKAIQENKQVRQKTKRIGNLTV